MPSFIDKVKQALDKGDGKADGTINMEKMKGIAGDLKTKVDGLVDKAGDKVPDKVKTTYDKVSDKVGQHLPAQDGAEGAEGADSTAGAAGAAVADVADAAHDESGQSPTG